MADFRKLLFVLIAGALLFTTVASADPFSCSITPTQTFVRVEGLADYVGDILLNCTGNVTDTSVGIVNVNIRLTMNNGVNITSNLLGASSLVSEASLIMNEGLTAGGRVWYGYGAPAGTQNVYQAVKVAENAVEWQGITIAAPGSNPFHTIRLTNVRVNAVGQPLGAAISGYVNIVSPTSFPIFGTNAVVVANVEPGLIFSVSPATWSSCVAPSPAATSPFNLIFKEGYGAAFKVIGNSLSQNFVPGGNYPNESGWAPGPSGAGVFGGGTLTGFSAYVASPLTAASTIIGQANQGTRLEARLQSIPLGVTAITVPGTAVSDLGGLTVTLVSAVSIATDRSAVILYEVTNNTGTSITQVDTVTIPVTFTFDYSVPAPIGVVTANGTFAPFASPDVTVMSYLAPEPRFHDTGTPNSPAFTFNGVCRSILFFPYLTNVTTSWDTGIAIINGSKDALGTAPQSGTCTLNYYGSVAGGTAAVPDLQGAGVGVAVTPTIPAGGQFIVTLSGGVGGVWPADAPFFTTALTPATASTCAVCAPVGFQGYMIARCNFQFAHGYAFVSDNGAQKLAHGYLALVIPDRAGVAVVTRLPQNAALGALGNQGEQLGN